MILVDFNQIVIANLVKQINPKNPEIDEDLVRHMVLNSLRLYRRKFVDEYGELVICCDDKNNWRKDFFPLYKANRKKDRGESSLDWPKIFDVLDKIKSELRENFPYKVIQKQMMLLALSVKSLVIWVLHQKVLNKFLSFHLTKTLDSYRSMPTYHNIVL